MENISQDIFTHAYITANCFVDDKKRRDLDRWMWSVQSSIVD